MSFLFELVQFPEGSRLTHVWDNRRVEQSRTGRTVSAHFVRLPNDQHADIESDFVSSHLPFSLGGIAGVHPDGAPWLLVLQQAAGFADSPLSFSEEMGILDHAVWRAMSFNPGAETGRGLGWRRGELLAAYQDRGVDPTSLELWTTADLVTGLLAECCGSELMALADGFVSGCAFPSEGHACQHDVFLDAFARWQQSQSVAE